MPSGKEHKAQKKGSKKHGSDQTFWTGGKVWEGPNDQGWGSREHGRPHKHKKEKKSIREGHQPGDSGHHSAQSHHGGSQAPSVQGHAQQMPHPNTQHMGQMQQDMHNQGVGGAPQMYPAQPTYAPGQGGPNFGGGQHPSDGQDLTSGQMQQGMSSTQRPQSGWVPWPYGGQEQQGFHAVAVPMWPDPMQTPEHYPQYVHGQPPIESNYGPPRTSNNGI